MSAAPTLVVVAHPDDETIFFGGLLLTRASSGVDVVCLTGGDHAGKGAARVAAFQRACTALGARRAECWGYRDGPLIHLPVADVATRLVALQQQRRYRAVFTHSPHGEYGHFNHMDTSLATLRAFEGLVPVQVLADRLYADDVVVLDRTDYLRKVSTLETYYRAEWNEAWPVVSLGRTEGYATVSLAEATLIHRLCTEGEPVDVAALDRYRHLASMLPRLARGWSSGVTIG